MAKNDDIDHGLASRLAWRVPGEDARDDLSEDPEPGAVEAPASEKPSGSLDERVHQAHVACVALASAVDRVWGLGPGELQAGAVVSLARQAEALGFGFAAMAGHPLQAIRLARLLVRHWERLEAEGATGVSFVLGFVDFHQHPEGVELVCDVAASGNSSLTLSLHLGGLDRDVHLEMPGLGARLAELLDQATTPEAKRQIGIWLSSGIWPAAVPALRRALKANLLGLRWLALDALLQHEPPAVTPEDVRFLLDDAVAHPLPDAGVSARCSDFDDSYAYAMRLLEAVASTSPPGGEAPLLSILEGEAAPGVYDSAFLDEHWALEALAAGYPTVALARVDRALSSARTQERYGGVRAAGRLSPDLARPRLLAATADPALRVAELARTSWDRCFDSVCPTPGTAGVPLELVDGPVGEEFASRLLVLRSASEAARQTMLAALLAAAPDRGALALIAFALGSDDVLREAPSSLGLPSPAEAWVPLLVERFGAPAFDALLWMAERFPRGPSPWLKGLASLLEGGKVPPEARARIRDFAVRRLSSPTWEGESEPLDLLVHLELPPELVGRLWEIAFSVVPARFRWAQYRAGELLGRLTGSAELASRLVPALDESLAQGDLHRARALVSLGFRTQVPEVRDLALRVLDLDGRQADVDDLFGIAYWIRDAGALPPTFIPERLARTGSPWFAVAARLLLRERSDVASYQGVLESALASSDLDGATAVAAAIDLLRAKLLQPQDPRVAAVLDLAAAPARSDLLRELAHRKVPVACHRAHLVEQLRSSEDEQATDLVTALWVWKCEGWEDLLREVYPSVTGAECREAIERVLRLPAPVETYWEVSGEEDD